MLNAYVLVATLVTGGLLLAGLVGIIWPIRAIGMTTRKQAAGVLGAGLGVAVLAIVVIGSSSPAPTQRKSSGLEQVQAVPQKPKIQAPPDQQNFVAAVISARDAYNAAPNDMAKGSVRVDRKRDLCAALRSFIVKQWHGTIYDLSSNNDGRGVLSIQIGPSIWVKTWNNALSDYSDGTLLSPDSMIYRGAMKLRTRQKVIFDGTFLSGDKDCVKEPSLSQSGAMLQPEFIMRFSDLAPIAE